MGSHIGAPSNRRNYHKLKGSGIKSTPDSFGKDMENLFKAYSEEVITGVIDETRETAMVGCDMLRESTFPSMTQGGSAHPMTRRQWKKYARSWDLLEDEGMNFYHVTIRNKRHYRLTHLLEYGHLTRNGTRTRAFEHIKPVDELTSARLLKNLPKIIGGDK